MGDLDPLNFLFFLEKKGDERSIWLGLEVLRTVYSWNCGGRSEGLCSFPKSLAPPWSCAVPASLPQILELSGSGQEPMSFLEPPSLIGGTEPVMVGCVWGRKGSQRQLLPKSNKLVQTQSRH